MEEKKEHTMTADEKWKAVQDCDARCDGIFYYGVRTTGIFCRPSCRSRKPNRNNVAFFDTPEEAARQGFRPCLRCRPDLSDFHPREETARKIRDLCGRHFRDRIRLKEEMGKLGIGRNRMLQIFQTYYGQTPASCVSRKRIDYACRRLTETGDSILQTAEESGFESMSAFYAQFKKIKGCTPKEYVCREREKSKKS